MLRRGQAAWVAHRRGKVAVQAMLANQIHDQFDLIFPGLTGFFTHGLDASLRVLIGDLPVTERRAPRIVLAADGAPLEALDQEIRDATAALAELLPKTSAGILLGVAGVGLLTASA